MGNYPSKEAEQAYNKSYYQKRSDEIKAISLAKVRVRRKELAERINLLKSVPCADCGGEFPPVCMDFDHTGDDKVDHVSRMVRNGYKLETVLKEIAKCEVVCANCHRLRTQSRKQYGRSSRELATAAVLKTDERKS